MINIKVTGHTAESQRLRKLRYLAKQIEAMYPQLKSERPRKPAKREALLMIERKTGKKQGTI